MILWTDSCQRNQSDSTVQRAYWSWAFGAGWRATGGRNNGNMNYANVVGFPRLPPPSGDTFIGFVRHIRNTGADGPFFSCLLVGAQQVALCTLSNGGLSVVRNGTLMAQTGAALVEGTILHGYAIKVKLHSTAGTVEVWMDGVHLTALDFTGNTIGQNSGGSPAPFWDSFHVGQSAGGGNSVWCDLMVADATNPSGSDVHDLVPDVCIDYRKPTASGYSSQFVGFDGDSVNNYLYVDDNSAPDSNVATSDTDWVQSTTPAIDAYVVTDHPVPGATILGRTAIAVARKTTTGVSNLRVGMRTSGVNTMGSSVGLLTTLSEVRANLPPQSEANFNASEVVVELL